MRPETGRSSDPRRGRRRGVATAMGGAESSASALSLSFVGMIQEATILLVEDEESVTKLLTFPLESDGYRVVHAADGEEALQRFAENEVDLVVLDIMLPKIDGLEVCRRVRAQSAVPIIILTARGEELDKVVGLELGADDYITKPFSIREFRSRVRAQLRRAQLPAASARAELIEADGVHIDVVRRGVALRGGPVQLTFLEFGLLRPPAANTGRGD